MKKNEKLSTKSNFPKKAAGVTKKNRRTASSGRPVPKRRKKSTGDALRAVILSGVLIVAAAFISMTVIIIHSTLKSGPASQNGTAAKNVSLSELNSIPEKTAAEPILQSTQIEPAESSKNRAVPATTQPAPAVLVPVLNSPAAAKPVITINTVPVATVPPLAESVPSAKPVPPARPAASRNQPPPQSLPVPVAQQPAPAVKPVPVANAVPASVVSTAKQPSGRGTIVFIIDDAGNNLRELEPFLRFPGPLTIAVLPGLPHSAEAARRIRAAGKEVFLHQPMEAIGGQAPGPGAIYNGMNADEIRAILRKNITEIGPIAGMNNHQGSKITMDEQAMITVLSFCREQGLYFLDSRTTAETAAPAAAKRLGMPIGERDIFLDNEQNKTAMLRYLNEGLSRLRHKDDVVMIGHTWSPGLAPILSEQYDSLVAQGYSFTTASALIGERTK